jgi:nucleotide-binding universal stress UspA family protein
MRVVKPPSSEELRAAGDQESIERLKENTLHRAKTYLTSIADHLREGPLAALKLTITWSVAVDDDVAHAIIHMAENGEDAEGAGVFGRCDLIAIATHGRGGFEHWVLGSITERVLGATKLPILIVRPGVTEFNRLSDGGETSEAPIQTKSILY